MIGVVLAIVCAGVLAAVLASIDELKPKSDLTKVVFAGFVLRLVMQAFMRELPLFSHGGGGDCVAYEQMAHVIAAMWDRTGIHYVTANELPTLGPTTLPPNIFALIIYLNGTETTRLGCTAIVALAAALTVLNIYRLAVQFGAPQRNALLFTSLIYFQPAFLFYTSDTYKDGLVVCLAIGALGAALRLASRFSLLHASIGTICILGLWYVRFYLVFVTVAPLVVGLVGLGSKSIVRPLLFALAVATLGLALVSFTDLLQVASDRAAETFTHATSRDVMAGNRVGGSAIEFDDGGSPYGALPAKLAYTLFAPFLWAGGSLGFHIGKFDVILWYFVAYRAVRAARTADRRLILMLMTFIVPYTLMYAMTLANVGLVVRQRLFVVAASSILAAIYVPRRAQERQQRVVTRARRFRPRAAA